MNIIKAFWDAILYRGSSAADKMIVVEAKSQAKEARDETQQKIENIYAQLNGCVERGDKWFLVPDASIDECGGGHKNG